MPTKKFCEENHELNAELVDELPLAVEIFVRWVTFPPKESTFAPASSEKVLKYVLYQYLLFNPWGRRKGLATDPRMMSAPAVTSNRDLPTNNVVGIQVSGSRGSD